MSFSNIRNVQRTGQIFGLAFLMIALVACGAADTQPPAATLTPVPTSTATPFASPTPEATATAIPTIPADQPEVTAETVFEGEEGASALGEFLEQFDEDEETLIQMIMEAADDQEIDPPLTIILPDDWRRGNSTLLMRDIVPDDVDGLRLLPFTLYTGPVTDGEGFIVLLWGFGSVMAFNPLMEIGAPDLWADGVRMLRLAVIEPGCNIGTDVQREYVIGGLPASGTQFSAVDCPETSDTRGWLAGIQQDGINFMFYIYTEPITAMDGPARAELQAILDTVEFNVDTLLESLTPSDP